MGWRIYSVLVLSLMSVVAQASELQDWLDVEVTARAQSADIPAVAIAVVHGPTVLTVGYGADPHTDIFRVGSVSKAINATLLTTLARQGKIDLHEDVNMQLASLPVTPELTQPLSLHHLLTHTAGFNERLFGQHTHSRTEFLSLHEYLSQHLPPRFIAPGVVLAYNDHHTALAAWLVAKKMGQPYEDLAVKYVFTPLHMYSSTYRQVDMDPSLTQRLIQAQPSSQGQPYPRDYIQLPAAAGLYTTAGDMARYLQALLDDSLPGTAKQLALQFSQHPQLPGRGYGFAQGQHAGDTYWFKDGQASGFNARVLVYPDQHFGMFVVHNRNIFGAFGAMVDAGRFNRRLSNDLLQELFPVQATPAPLDQPAAQLMSNIDLNAYAGVYRTTVAARHTWERLASLFDEAAITVEDNKLRLGRFSYSPLSTELFSQDNNADRVIAFRRIDDVATHVFIGGGAYERVPWWTTQAGLPWVVGGAMLVLLTCAIWLSRRRSWSDLVMATPLALFFLGISLVFGLKDIQQLFYGPPWELVLLLVLPICALATVGVHVWQMRHGNVMAHLLSVLASGVLLAWLSYWNLLGFHFG